MAKCVSNGLEYPFYIISAYVWKKNTAKENDGDYVLRKLLETEDFTEAISAFKQAKITNTRPEIKLEMDNEESVEWLNTKDETGYHSDYGIT